MNEKNSSDSAVAVRGKPRSRFFVWVVLLAAVLGWFLHQSLFCGRGLTAADGVLSYYPWHDPVGPGNNLLSDQYLVFAPQHEFVYQQFLAGHFPLWNPYLDCGVPNLASSQGAQLFPINLLLLPVAPFHAAGLAAFLKLFLAGWFAMLYARALGVSSAGAFLTGVVFSLCGFMIVWLGHPHVNSALWLPLFPYLIERFFQCVRARAPVTRVCVFFSLAYGGMLLGGHPPTMVHVTLFIGAYFGFRWFEHRRELPVKPALFLGGAAALGILLAAPAILPFLEYDHFSSEQVSSHDLQRSASHLPLNSLIFYLLPHLNGSPVNGWQDTLFRLGVGDNVPNFNERTGYAGILPVLLALYAVVRLRGRLVWFYAVMIVACLLAVCGVPPLPALFAALPVLHATNQMRLTLLIAFGVAVLAGLGWDQFWRPGRTRSKGWVVAGFWTVIGLVLAGYALAVAPRWHGLDPACQAYLIPQVLMLAGSLVVSGLLVWRGISRRLAAGVVLGWVVVDLLLFATGFNPEIPRDRYYPSTPAIDWLKQHAGPARILGQRTILVPNTAEVFALRDARGCDFTTVRRYEELIDGAAGNFQFYLEANSLPGALPLTGVKYLLARNSASLDPALFEEVYSNEVKIYRYRPACERALVVPDYRVEPDPAVVLPAVRSNTFDPRRWLWLEEHVPPASAAPRTPLPVAGTNSSVRITADQADRVELAASLAQPGFLLLLDTYFPGWTATVNGRPAKIYRADYNFRAVQLPAGQALVCFTYRPATFRYGLILAALSLLTLGGAFWSSRPRVKS